MSKDAASAVPLVAEASEHGNLLGTRRIFGLWWRDVADERMTATIIRPANDQT